MTKQVTIKEFASIQEIDYLTASALIKWFVHIGAAKEVGKKAQETGRGKPSVIYEIDNEISLCLWEDTEAKETLPEPPSVETVAPVEKQAVEVTPPVPVAESEKTVDATENKDNTKIVEQVI